MDVTMDRIVLTIHLDRNSSTVFVVVKSSTVNSLDQNILFAVRWVVA